MSMRRFSPRYRGYMIKQDYREGSVVQSGEVLFEIDPRPFRATLDQAGRTAGAGRAQLGFGRHQLMRGHTPGQSACHRPKPTRQ